jgi:ATP-dependent RNA helicase DDX5/DBP2
MMDGSRVIVFTGTKRAADDLTYNLRKNNWPARSIHGDKSQNERDWVLAEFKSGKTPLLIATDVAARGLGTFFGFGFLAFLLPFFFVSNISHLRLSSCLCSDVKDVKAVINYDFPSQIEDYVHRIGRTGRAGNKGHSITLFTSGDAKKARELVELLELNKQHVPKELYQWSRHMGGGGGNRRWNSNGYGGNRGGYGGSSSYKRYDDDDDYSSSKRSSSKDRDSYRSSSSSSSSSSRDNGYSSRDSSSSSRDSYSSNGYSSSSSSSYPSSSSPYPSSSSSSSSSGRTNPMINSSSR